MRQLMLFAAIALFAMQTPGQTPQPDAKASPHWAIALHGGAGVIERKTMDPKTEAAYRASLAEALKLGSDVLDKGGSSLDAVETAIRSLEDNPSFNAGKGAVFTAEGHNELDAAIMDGATLKAGAVAGVTLTKNPITLARAVMEQSPHVMLIGAGADAFAAAKGLQMVDPSYFFTERRWDALIDQLKREGQPLPPRPANTPPAPMAQLAPFEPRDAHKYGTVGVVALDRKGNIAAGTSTGGIQAKLYGRVGDSPIYWAQVPTPQTPPAPSRPRGPENISSVLPSRARSALWSNTNTCRSRRLPTM